LALVISIVTGVCTYQGQAADRELVQANRLRDQAAQQSALKVSVLSIDAPKVVGAEIELRIEVRVSNHGGSATSVVAARTASLADLLAAFSKDLFTKRGESLKWTLADPPPPSHPFRPAIRIEPGAVADLSVRVRFETTASTLDELRRILTPQRDIGQLRLEDVNGQLSTVTLWDCALKLSGGFDSSASFEGKKHDVCTGALFG
jgi:hypothetical protein